MNIDTLESLELLFLSLSDKTRLRLVGLMSRGEVSVGYLADSLGQSQPKVSRHLAYLRNAGLVSTRRDGKWIYYSIEQPADAATRRVLGEIIGSLDGLESFAVESGPTRDLAVEEPTESEYVPQDMETFLL